jgi:hypothetical protein
MKKGLTALVSLLVMGLAAPASADHVLPAEEAAGVIGAATTATGPLPDLYSPEDEHSPNMSLIANFDDGGTYRQGSDEAFWGHHAILSSFDNPGGFRIVDIANPRRPVEIGQFVCQGSQADVSVWEDLVFVSVDSPRATSTCGAAGDTPGAVAGTAWEGVRVVDISDPANPQQIAAVYTDCGSHTNTLVPDTANGRVLVYSLSYPLNPQGAKCNPASHRKFSVVEVPLDNPAGARVSSTPDVSPAVGCHDVTVYPATGLAAAACLTESQMWDISDPVNPEILSHIRNPQINIHHSSTFSWDGNMAVIGDELTGATVTPGCPEGADKHMPLGALWFYDVSDPANPVVKGSYHVPQGEGDSALCTAHNFNTVPLKSERDVLVSGWYNGGTTVVDFTDPGDPQQLGFYTAHGPTQSSGTAARPDMTVRSTAWSSYFYNGHIYANNFDEDVNSISPISRGMDVFSISDPVFRKSLRVPHLNAQTMLRARGQR